MEAPEAVLKLLQDDAATEGEGRAAPQSPATTVVSARPADALRAAALVARSHGVAPILLSDRIEGEAQSVAAAMAEDLKTRLKASPASHRPFFLISGGETTVTLGDDDYGRGGRNTEFLLALALALDGVAGVSAIACDTDGIDGDGPAAGAIIDPNTLARARRLGLDPEDGLRRHDSQGFFAALGDLITTGPTRTNVNDFRAILVAPSWRSN